MVWGRALENTHTQKCIYTYVYTYNVETSTNFHESVVRGSKYLRLNDAGSNSPEMFVSCTDSDLMGPAEEISLASVLSWAATSISFGRLCHSVKWYRFEKWSKSHYEDRETDGKQTSIWESKSHFCWGWKTSKREQAKLVFCASGRSTYSPSHQLDVSISAAAENHSRSTRKTLTPTSCKRAGWELHGC